MPDVNHNLEVSQSAPWDSFVEAQRGPDGDGNSSCLASADEAHDYLEEEAPRVWIWIVVAAVVALTVLGILLLQDESALQAERQKAERLSKDLTTAWVHIGAQSASLGDLAMLKEQVSGLRQALKTSEAQADGLQARLDVVQEVMRAQPVQPEPTQLALPSTTVAPEVDGLRGNAPAASEGPVLSEVATKPAVTTWVTPPRFDVPLPGPESREELDVRPTSLEGPDAVHLTQKALILIGQGNIGAARLLLERAIELGSKAAFFPLAETYNSAVLQSWGAIGTLGDVAYARQLYQRALENGTEDARERLTSLAPQ